MEQNKPTPLYESHLFAEGKLVPFAGYLLPVQYPTGTIAEHMAVRTAAGLFDVSHMGEFRLTGPDALPNLQRLLTNQMEGMHDGQARYSPMCNDAGGVVDDLLVYRFREDSYLLVVNAANRQKDKDFIARHLTGDCAFLDHSDRVAQLALQGPKAPDILARLASPDSIPQKYYHFVEKGVVAGIPCVVAHTGYTGETGFEFYCDPEDAPALWDILLMSGEQDGLIPCGLGARDTLRLEAAMPLYGHEMDETVTPLEAGLGFAVKLHKKEDFIGKQALLNLGEPKRRRIGLYLTARGIAREGDPVLQDGRIVGRVTSGTFCPYLKRAAAMALVDRAAAESGAPLEVDVRGKKIPAERTALPFYSVRH